MLGMLINNAMPWAPNTWKIWVEHIMKQKKNYGFKKASMVHIANGATASATSGFIVPQHDVQKLKACFGDEKMRPESVCIMGKTYIVREMIGNQLVCFNGSKYFIIGKAKTMYIIVMCDSRLRVTEGAKWIGKLTDRLIEKDF